jgi:nicotinamidase/pyrazinamidase
VSVLILVDLQNDFVPGGALPAPGGHEVVPVANRLQPHFDLVIASQDWHPANHGSFAANHPGKKVGDVIDLAGIDQILWPIHCVQNTPGADFVPDLRRDRIENVFQKGIDADIDSYSALYDNGHRRSTGMAEFLKARGVGRVHLLGLTTDYCVKFSALDAREMGFEVVVILDGCRAVNLNPGDGDRAVAEMKRAGVEITDSAAVIAAIGNRSPSGAPR